MELWNSAIAATLARSAWIAEHSQLESPSPRAVLHSGNCSKCAKVAGSMLRQRVFGVSVNSKGGLDLDAASVLNVSRNGVGGPALQQQSVMTIFNNPQFSGAPFGTRADILTPVTAVHVRHGAAPRLLTRYTRRSMARRLALCWLLRQAAYPREPVVVQDIATSPL